MYQLVSPALRQLVRAQAGLGQARNIVIQQRPGTDNGRQVSFELLTNTQSGTDPRVGEQVGTFTLYYDPACCGAVIFSSPVPGHRYFTADWIALLHKAAEEVLKDDNEFGRVEGMIGYTCVDGECVDAARQAGWTEVSHFRNPNTGNTVTYFQKIVDRAVAN